MRLSSIAFGVLWLYTISLTHLIDYDQISNPWPGLVAIGIGLALIVGGFLSLISDGSAT